MTRATVNTVTRTRVIKSQLLLLGSHPRQFLLSKVLVAREGKDSKEEDMEQPQPEDIKQPPTALWAALIKAEE
jgi:hypothetical protein